MSIKTIALFVTFLCTLNLALAQNAILKDIHDAALPVLLKGPSMQFYEEAGIVPVTQLKQLLPHAAVANFHLTKDINAQTDADLVTMILSGIFLMRF